MSGRDGLAAGSPSGEISRGGRPTRPSMVYMEALDRSDASCQRKGDRPRGGFRLPWARCHADAWEEQLGGRDQDRLTQ